MIPPSGEPDYLARLSRAIYAGMTKSDPDAVWVLQGWPFMYKRSFWTQPRFKAFLDAIPHERMIVLDLYCETTPMWNATDAFCGKPWLWCNVQNFGDRVALGAALDRNNTGLHEARRAPQRGNLSGLGFVNEGLDYNPLAYDFMFEMAWRDEPVDLKAWIASYAQHRYGKAQPDAQRAWQALLATVYSAPLRESSVITRAPTLARLRDVAPYDSRRLVTAWEDMMRAADELRGRDAFRGDLVNVARQTLANHASTLHARIGRAWRAKDVAEFERATGHFLELIYEMDTLLATRPEFLLGTWLEDAKRWGATDAERARLEWNARRVITLWGDTPALNDYARKQWAGMLADYYAARWKQFFDAAAAALRTGKSFDAASIQPDLLAWTQSWAGSRKIYPNAPVGDSVTAARALWTKYRDELTAPAEPVTDEAPDAVSLTTGKPATSSSHMPAHPPRLANDGFASDSDQFWATDTKTDAVPWWQVDLQQPTSVGRVVVITYYGDDRHYAFTVEVSNDGQRWDTVADRRNNEELATPSGYSCAFPPRSVRYIRITQTHNSANTGRHLVEVQAFEK
jgi:alpha-N-acetylglucosaminidase